MKAHGDRVPIWNVWWTLTMLSAAFTVLVIILEYLGVFRDFGLVLGALGVIATIIFGFSASTRSSVRALDDRLGGIDNRLVHLDDRLAGMDQRLGGLVDGQRGTNEALIRIEELLRARLPAA